LTVVLGSERVLDIKKTTEGKTRKGLTGGGAYNRMNIFVSNWMGGFEAREGGYNLNYFTLCEKSGPVRSALAAEW